MVRYEDEQPLLGTDTTKRLAKDQRKVNGHPILAKVLICLLLLLAFEYYITWLEVPLNASNPKAWLESDLEGWPEETHYIEGLVENNTTYIHDLCYRSDLQKKEDYTVKGVGHIPSYAGTVPIRDGAELFFWYFPNDGPLLIWLQGGPGATSQYAALREQGPFRPSPDDPKKMMPNEYSWLKAGYSLLFIDSPVNTGYSITKKISGLDHRYYHHTGLPSSTVAVAQDLICFMRNWGKVFEIGEKPVFITGESYGGKYVPAMTVALHRYNDQIDTEKNREHDPKFNLKGIAVGNGFIYPEMQVKAQPDHLFNLGLVSSNQKALLTWQAQTVFECYHAQDMAGTRAAGFEYLTMLYYFSGGVNQFDVRRKTEYNDTLIETSLTDLRSTLNVHHDRPFSFISLEVNQAMMRDWLRPMLPVYKWILKNTDLRVMLYHGQFDLKCGVVEAAEYLDKMFEGAQRKAWEVGNHNAGFVRQRGRLTEVAIQFAGHMVPMDAPKAALEMIQTFVNNKAW